MNYVKTYSELIQIPGYIERFNYLKLDGKVGELNLEVHRWLNQHFYHTAEWRRFRDQIIVRDMGYDLAHSDRPIFGRIIIHHINPITAKDVIDRSGVLFDPENAISVSHITHNAIHYGDENLLPHEFVERKPNDTCLWKTD